MFPFTDTAPRAAFPAIVLMLIVANARKLRMIFQNDFQPLRPKLSDISSSSLSRLSRPSRMLMIANGISTPAKTMPNQKTYFRLPTIIFLTTTLPASPSR